MPRYTLSVCVCVCVCVFPVVFDRSHCPNILSCVFGLALACFQGSWPTVDHSGWSVGPGMAAHRDDDDLLFPGIELELNYVHMSDTFGSYPQGSGFRPWGSHFTAYATRGPLMTACPVSAILRPSRSEAAGPLTSLQRVIREACKNLPPAGSALGSPTGSCEPR